MLDDLDLDADMNPDISNHPSSSLLSGARKSSPTDSNSFSILGSGSNNSDRDNISFVNEAQMDENKATPNNTNEESLGDVDGYETVFPRRKHPLGQGSGSAPPSYAALVRHEAAAAATSNSNNKPDTSSSPSTDKSPSTTSFPPPPK